MSKPKRSGRPPQAQHAKKSGPSQHDKRQRLRSPNPRRRATHRAAVPLTGALAQLAAPDEAKMKERFERLLSLAA